MIEALLIDKEQGARQTTARFATLPDTAVADDEATLDGAMVRVAWSSLNYKDALAITGRAPVVRRFPMVPGIDLAGTRSADGRAVLATGFGLGERYWGGLATQARVPDDWLIPIPPPLSVRQAMAIGTAGFTALLCLEALEAHGVTPASGPVVVSGASGGVGSIAVMLLARLGYDVAAMTGRPAEESFLTGLGARRIVARAEYEQPGKPLAAEEWAAAIDVAGGHVLANLCARLRPGGVVAACGLAGGMDLPASVAPFILRGITLAGIDSVHCPVARRAGVWARLATLLDPAQLDAMTSEVAFADVIAAAHDLLEGRLRGRVVVRLPA
ncbi:alcohol dehydrogenase [Ameyamaea chiangmaiensis NBRC 103196]|uniref:MDR family oxidoreductase n=1 Tax=Ameyamaea chiangmaiensis TaxID=442969 RepID=UPI001BAEF10E|nr:MDR family oxidoreductase [Ameyamaea chiangmaiensis]MBS4074770.1 oxidoreductase [Ameyamaea chiangmaiensis]GBQ62679.1 alcohol dehydrogenase [Ameyamaea chiangmaiensis NBRC 103196]